MQMKRSDTAATIFSRVSAPPPPLIIAKPPSISSAPSTYTGRDSMPLRSNTSMPCAASRRELASELETAPTMRSRMPASASMKWLTVEPVPTPTMLPSAM